MWSTPPAEPVSLQPAGTYAVASPRSTRAGPSSSSSGGGPAENAAIARAILAGELGPRSDTVALNAAAALVAADLAEDFPAGLALAREALTSGAAAGVLERLVAYTSV